MTIVYVVVCHGDLQVLRTFVAKDCSAELFQMLKYTVACANRYFRILHGEGLWLEAPVNLLVAKAGDEMCASRHL